MAILAKSVNGDECGCDHDEAAKSRKGFASMDREKQRAIASKGGKTSHAKGRAHEFTSDEAREAGKKGGAKVSANRAHMAEIGRLGGQSRARAAAKRRERGES